MQFNPLRMITYFALILITFLIIFFTDMNMRAILSIALIMVFLLIFTFIFKTDGSKTLKVAMILATFLALPLFIIVYLNVFTEFWSLISALVIVGIIGVLSIVTMVKLDYVELKWE